MIDQADLTLNTSTEVEESFFHVNGGVTNAGQNWLVYEPEVEAILNNRKSFAVLVSGNWQFGLSQELIGGDIQVFTKKVK